MHRHLAGGGVGPGVAISRLTGDGRTRLSGCFTGGEVWGGRPPHVCQLQGYWWGYHGGRT